MKRLFLSLLFLLLLVNTARGAMDWTPKIWRAGGPWWLDSSLTFWAPFDDPSNPLKLNKGTGSLSFTRTHDATHTATYVRSGTGLVTVADNNQLRIEAQGALVEGARTNSLLWSRTFDNAAWVKTNVSVSANQIGEDGVANSAYSVLATADNGTLSQPVTIASATYTGAFSLKRITGIGTVMISLDNGATWGPNVASSLSTSAWYRASKENQTLANPVICLKLGTSGDNVAVDYAQIEAGASASSRIPTTSAATTRNADQLTAPTSENVNGTTGTVSVEVQADDFTPSSGREIYIIDLGTDRPVLAKKATITALSYYDGTNIWPSVINSVFNNTEIKKIANSYSGSSLLMSYNGAISSPQLFDGNWDVGTNLTIGSYSGYSPNNFMFGHIKNLRIWNRSLSDSELVAITK